MKTALTKSLFVIGILVVATSLVLVSVLTDVGQSSTNWTYGEDDKYFLNEWKEAGGGDMSTWGFPDSVLSQFDISSRKMAPEIFFSREFQMALFSSREQFSVMPDSSEYLTRLLGTKMGDNEIALAIENEKRKLAAMSRLSSPDELPTHVLEGLEFQFQQARSMQTQRSETLREWRNLNELTTIPAEEAFAMLHPIDQERLAQYRTRLTDVISNPELGREMSDAQRGAVGRLKHLAQKQNELPFVWPPELMAQSQREYEQGYGIRPSDIAPTVNVRRSIEGRSDSPLSSFLTGSRTQAEVLQISSTDGRKINQNLNPVPSAYILPDSENFLVRQSRNRAWSRYFSKTTFGGAVLIEQLEVTDVQFLYPNLVIAGKDARLLHEMYMDNHWVTRVTAFNGLHQYRFIADGKLENAQKAAFIEFCRQIAEAHR